MNKRNCWCGESKLQNFSPEYSICNNCQTLVSQKGLSNEEVLVNDDEKDFYGKKYWLTHQNKDLGFPDIHQRARNDLTERCLHWLVALLKYKLSPQKVLEIGCGHGGFLALLQAVGYEVTGLELSPWVAEFGRNAFNVPILVGLIEEQNLPPNSFDTIALMDVLEHLSDPYKTLQNCIKLLKKDGILIIQTPCFPQKSYSEMIKEKHRFLEVMKSDEHLYLFSKFAAEKFFNSLGIKHIQYEIAIFDHYDMFFFLSHEPFKINTQQKIDEILSANVQRRIIQAAIDLYIRLKTTEKFVQKIAQKNIRNFLKKLIKFS